MIYSNSINSNSAAVMRSFDEIGLIPAQISGIKSRKEVNPFYVYLFGDGTSALKLPVFVSPMTCLIDGTNYDSILNDSKFVPIYPVRFNNRAERDEILGTGNWVAYTLKEFEELLVTEQQLGRSCILIDTAQGHMQTLYDQVSLCKKHFPDTKLMIGNICNPYAYLDCCKAGVDYVRVSVGTGTGCTTSVKTGFHASLPYILTVITNIKKVLDGETDVPDDVYRRVKKYLDLHPDWDYERPSRTKVIADGGLDDIGKINKALALGADFVMIGGLFARTGRGCSSIHTAGHDRYTVYYGQASSSGQLDRFGSIRNVPEGISRKIQIDWTLNGLESELEGSLRSAMSYAGTRTLDDFVGQVEYMYQSDHEFEMFNKRSR